MYPKSIGNTIVYVCMSISFTIPLFLRLRRRKLAIKNKSLAALLEFSCFFSFRHPLLPQTPEES